MTVAYSREWNPASRTTPTRSIAIIGGGASGVLMAAHLLRNQDPGIDITIVEKRAALGRGLAYSTELADHVLNARAPNMSAFADDPNHFVRWLEARGVETGDSATYFAPRRLYGEYLGDLLHGTRDGDGSSSRLNVVGKECVEVIPHDSRVELRLADGSNIVADCCVLATGHDEKPGRPEVPPAPLASIYDDAPAASEPVLIIGTGLSMVDACLSLILSGHAGPIFALSRRGLLPAVHTRTAPLAISETDVPLGTDLTAFMRWFRDLIQSQEAAGGNWRDVVDGLRPYNQLIWQSWPENAKRRFFRHMKAWWDIHRHRMAPQVHERLANAIADNQLRVIAGRLLDIEPASEGFAARLQHRTSKLVEEIEVARIYDCAGIIADPAKSSNAAIRSLLEHGAARPDRLHIGLDVSPEGALIDRDGVPSGQLYAVGPLTRGTFFEIEAVPDIRVQCQKLAGVLVQGSGQAAAG